MNLIRSIIKALSTPLPLFWALIAVGVFLFILKFNKPAIIISLFALLFLFFASTPWLPEYFLDKLESKYPYLLYPEKVIADTSNVTYIHILAAGNSNDSMLSYSAQLHFASKNRIIEGIRIYNRIANAKFLLTGGGEGSLSSADLHARALMEMGIPKKDIITISKGWNTYTEAIAISESEYADKKLIMVTDATHMLRAMAIFNKLDVYPVPAPTTFRLRKNNYNRPISDYFPSAHYLDYSELVMYSYFGMMWMNIAWDK